MYTQFTIFKTEESFMSETIYMSYKIIYHILIRLIALTDFLQPI